MPLAFQARLGDGAGGKDPPISYFEWEKGWRIGWKCVAPLCLIFQVRECDGGDWKDMPPSILSFEQGRNGVIGRKCPPLSCIWAREGGWEIGWKDMPPLCLAFWVREGDGGGWKDMAPLHLAFRVRERIGGWLEGCGPLHIVFQARGLGIDWKEMPPSISLFEWGGSGDQLAGDSSLHLAFWVREGWGIVWNIFSTQQRGQHPSCCVKTVCR